MKSIFLIALAIAGSLILSRCGQPVCIAGFGQCGTPLNPNTTTSTSGLSMTAPASTMAKGSVITLTASGGTPPYTFSFAPTSQLVGSLSNQTATTVQLTAPMGTGVMMVRVTDSTNATFDLNITSQ